MLLIGAVYMTKTKFLSIYFSQIEFIHMVKNS
jgi:hypothetical protein